MGKDSHDIGLEAFFCTSWRSVFPQMAVELQEVKLRIVPVLKIITQNKLLC